jgi:hypothetical protein
MCCALGLALRHTVPRTCRSGGPIFGSMENYNEVAVRKRIKDLSDYRASLQQKES